jgi:hypothetical protein
LPAEESECVHPLDAWQFQQRLHRYHCQMPWIRHSDRGMRC